MEGFDDPGVYVGSAFNDLNDGDVNPKHQTAQRLRKKFKDFLRTFNVGGFDHVYRDRLKQNYDSGKFYLEVKVEDLRNFDDELEKVIRDSPAEFLHMFEEALTEVADEVTKPRREGEEKVHDMQIILQSDALPVGLRQVKSTQVSQLVKIAGIVIKSSQVKSKASRVSIKCRSCYHVESDIPINPGLEGYSLPRRCSAPQTYNAVKCPLDPYLIIPDRSRCVDFQVLQLQENPEDVPAGETPRQLKLYLDRYLTDRVAPGNRVTLLGIYSIRKMSSGPSGRDREKVSAGVRTPYIRVIGIDVDSVGGSSGNTMFSATEESDFRNFARRDDVYETIAKSIAPSIYGSLDIKKALVCLLFGGSRKRLPDGLTRRGDINVLLLGDPGTAKSQLLKFIERVSPIGVYTSGKGSSAAGLTASINRDMVTRTFVVEGGAMVLADGGVVCIDEFDKMNEDDRVAIHEAMEQQTISIAKAGITTTLNSRCSVLAAANATHGRWDDTKGEENIDFMPTILSRFDMIFLVKDVHNEKMDMTLARHVIKVHVNDGSTGSELEQGELSLEFIKRYVAYCKSHCAPRLNEEAAATLRNRYVLMRSGANMGDAGAKKSVIPITVRQLEAIVRISESLAKLELSPFAGKQQIEEALRLFKVSTLETAQSGHLAGVEGFTSEQDHALSNRIESQLKRRFAVGTQVSEYVVLTDFGRQGYSEHAIRRVIQFMVRRGELQHRMQRKMLYRLR